MTRYWKNSKCARHWFKFVVLPSLLPIAFSIFYDIVLGYTFTQILSRHFLDVILFVFAISVSIFDIALGLFGNTEKKENYIGISVLIGIICVGFYGILYDKANELSLRMIIFRILVLGLLVFIIPIGMRMQSEYDNNDKKENNNIY